MGFHKILEKYDDFDFENYFKNVDDEKVLKSINKDELNEYDFLNLISPSATKYLEQIAQKANKLTKQYFGNTIQLYIPIYISNYCTNRCIYCGFNNSNDIIRKKLSLEEIEKEAIEIAKTGIKHILVLTGEAEKLSPLSYVKDASKILKKYFDSISIEVFPMEASEYKELKDIGVDGLTVYQETYDKKVYEKVHLAGKKRDFMYRLNTPERGAMAGLRTINIGALYGLSDVKKEAFFTILHAKYLTDKYIKSEIGVSLPRIKKAEGGFEAYEYLDDSYFVQIMLAYRLFIPRIGINVSTRESSEFRDNILNLGVTKFSAGSRTDIGGYSDGDKTEAQFEISDDRSVEEIVEVLEDRGFQVVYKDWENL